jgi:hypothetical protein
MDRAKEANAEFKSAIETFLATVGGDNSKRRAAFMRLKLAKSTLSTAVNAYIVSRNCVNCDKTQKP